MEKAVKQGVWSVLSIVLISLFLLCSCTGGSSSHSAQDELYSPYQNVIFNLDLERTKDTPLHAAFSLYEAGKYTEALDAFLSLDSTQISPDIHFYIGQCHLAQSNYAESKPYLVNAGKYGSAFGSIAKYYIAIVDYEMGKHDVVMRRLRSMIEGGRLGSMSERGQQLLEYYEEQIQTSEDQLER